MAIHISNPDVVELVRRVEDELRLGTTEAIERGMKALLVCAGLPISAPQIIVAKPVVNPDLIGRLDQKVREIATIYRDTQRMRKLAAGEKRPRTGTRIYPDLARFGPVETVRLYVMKGTTEGARTLIEAGREESTFERLVLSKTFGSLFDETTKAKAHETLDDASSSSATESRPTKPKAADDFIKERASYGDVEIVRYANGRIGVLRNGIEQAGVVKRILEPIAFKLGVDIRAPNRRLKTTHVMGRDVIRAIKAQGGGK